MADGDDFLAQAPIMNLPVELTDEEKAIIDEVLEGEDDNLELKIIIQKACGPGIDGRSKKGTAVKDYLATKGIAARPSHVYKKKGDSIVLTEHHQEFIANNAGNMKLLELTRVLFSDNNLSNLSSEFRAVKAYYDTLDGKVKTPENDDIDIKEYYPPKHEAQGVARVNRYVLGGIQLDNVTPKQRECIAKLIRYMHTHRFIFEMESLNKTSERKMLESSFVRYTWDKPDLTEEDIDLYVNLCSEQILYERMKQQLVMWTEEMEMQRQTDGRMPMAMVEAINKLRGDIDSTSKKMEKTLQSLNGRRDKRLEKINSDNLSLLSLVEAVRDVEKRKRLAEVFSIRKEKIKNEANRLEGLGEDVFEIFGASKVELTE